ncbi:MAG: GC-type dockerin domain-anchored protein [Phycisphaerales bacterium]|nr:GC-type dockerin domain-anchored protein [Phycisphaerales bacterium]
MSRLKSVRAGTLVRLENLLLEPGLQVDLEVERIDPFAGDAQIIIMHEDTKGTITEKASPAPDVQILVGRIVGEPDSQVILGLSRTGCNGYISSSEGIHLVANPSDGDGASVIYGIGDDPGRVPLRLKPGSTIKASDSQKPKSRRERQRRHMDGGTSSIQPAQTPPQSRIKSNRGVDADEQRGGALNQGACCVPDTQVIDQYGRYTDWNCVTVLTDTTDPANTIPAEQVCLDQGGIFKPEYGLTACQGLIDAGTDCTDLSEGDMPGACCLQNSDFSPGEEGYCLQTSLKMCEAMDGTFLGFGPSCEGSSNCSSERIGCTTVKIAIDADLDFLNFFDGNAIKAANYIAFLVGASSQVYQDEVGIRLKLTQIRLWSSGQSPWEEGVPILLEGPNSPYDAPYTNGGDVDLDDPQWLLGQLATVWQPCSDCELPNIVQLLSGGSFETSTSDIGNGLCFGVSFSFLNGLNGAFPYPLADFRPENFDLISYLRSVALLARTQFEGLPSVEQTQCLSQRLDIPIFIDECRTCLSGITPCILPEDFPPTIMSSCYECDGGVSNMSLKFHPYVRGILYQYFSIAPGCAVGGTPVSAMDDVAFAVPGLPVFIDVLGNDSSEGCVNGVNDVELQLDRSSPPYTTPTITALRGVVDYINPDPSNPTNDRLIYQSPCDLFEGTICPTGNPMLDWPLNPQLPDYTDSFAYQASLASDPFNTNGSVVRVKVSPPPYNWPSVCISGQNANQSGVVATSGNATSLPTGGDIRVMNMNITVPLDANSDPIPVDILSMSYLNLRAFNFNTSLAVEPSDACFELWVDGERVVNYQDQVTGADVYLFCPYDSNSGQPYVNGDTCGGWSFIEPSTLESRVSTTTGDIFLRLVWEGNDPADDLAAWQDGRVYLQADTSWPNSDWNASGACCVDDLTVNYCLIVNGNATQTAAANCVEQGGVFLGVGTECGSSEVGNGEIQNYCSPSIPVSLGACCIPGGLVPGECLCAVTTEPACIDNGGLFFEYTQDSPLGYDKLCFAQTCNTNVTSPGVCNNNATAEGACCYEVALGTQVCDILTYENCQLLPNSYYAGDAVPCLDYICNDPLIDTGACCLANGFCIPNRTREFCDLNSTATYLGEGSECSDCVAATAIGRCCVGRYYCMDGMDYLDCLAIEGTFTQSTSCTDDCFIGSCCVDGNCFDDIDEPACTVLGAGATWLGPNTNTNGSTAAYCDTQPCIEIVPDIGLCCVEQVCYMVTQSECEVDLGGYFPNIAGLSCESGFCLQGGCCLGQFPVITDRAGCEAITDPLNPSIFLYGLYPDDVNFTSCTGCPWDIDGDGTADVDDLITLLGLFGSNGGQGDINYDGVVDVQDLLEILANWATGC